MNSINWSAPNIWVFIAQLVEHCSINAEAMGLNPIESLKILGSLVTVLVNILMEISLCFHDDCT